MVLLKMLVNGTSRFAELLDGVASGQLKASTVKISFDSPFSKAIDSFREHAAVLLFAVLLQAKEMLAIEMGEYYSSGARAQVAYKSGETTLRLVQSNPELNVA